MARVVCRPDVVNHQVAIESFALRSDGLEVAYVLRRVQGSTYQSHVWTVPTRGGRARQLTRGDVRDSSPAFSPDGQSLAFVRTPLGADHGQAWLAPLAGGEPWRLTDMKHGVSSVHWSPNGRWLALRAPSGFDRPFIVGPDEPGKAPRARRMTRLDWRDDEEGHRDRRTHLFLVRPRAGARPKQLTQGDWDVANPVWAPDSSSIAFATDQREDRDLYPRSSIWSVAPNGGSPREIAALRGNADYPAFSPDGLRLAFLGCDVDDAPEFEPLHPWLVPVAGGPPVQAAEIGEGLAGTWAWSELDLIEGAPGPLWLGADSLVCLVSRRARCVPVELRLDGSAVDALVEQDRVLVSGMDVAGETLVVSATTDGWAADLFAVEKGRLSRLTGHGSSWQRRYHMPRLDEVEVPGPAGSINTWLLSPPGAGKRPLPTIIHFHGGPTGSFGPGGSMDAMLWTSAGYRVAMPNIRGSASFGYDWADALRGRWGDADAEDAQAVVDWLVGQGLTDERRIGLYGLSYGGFLVQWLIGVTDRFAAAVSENGVANQVSTWANSYFGVEYNRRLKLGDPLSLEGMTRLWSSSPLSNVARMNTPLLILQGEEDRVCPAADNEQLFTALRALGREVEYVLYPEEHHEFKVYGRPDRRIDRHERVIAWFLRHLGSGTAT